jgi:hypothetical protein
MVVAYDSQHDTAIISSGGSTTVTPVGTPAGIVVFASILGNDADLVSGFTYGGVPMIEMANSRMVSSAPNELGSLWGFFLGEGVPAGAQSLVLSGSGSVSVLVYVYVLTADDDLEIVTEATIGPTVVESPSGTIALAGRTCWVCEAFVSGKNFSFQIAAITDWTYDDGDQAASMSSGQMRYDIIDLVTPVTIGYTAGAPAEEVLLLAAAISEVQAGGGPDLPLLGVE